MSSITDSVVSMPAFEKITNSDGSVNTNYVDLLDVDKPIAGQKFACMSFVSPEKILKMRELFYFEEFLKQWKFSKSFECFTSFLNFISFKYSLKFEDLNKDLIDFCENEKETLLLSRVDDDYKQYIEELIEGENSTKKSSASTPENKKKKPVSMVKDYTDMSTDTVVDITITFTPGIIKELLAKEGDHGCNGLEKLLKLYTTKSNTNMHAFDENEKLVKYNTINELIEH